MEKGNCVTKQKDTTAQRFRDYLREHGPQTTQQLMAAFGMKWAQVWGACRPQVSTGRLLFDEVTKCYAFGRNPEDRQRQTPEQRREVMRRYEAKRAEERRAMRPAKPTPTPEEVEALRLKRLQTKRAKWARASERRRLKVQSGAPMRLVQNKEVRKRDHATRQGERADAAQVMRNREHGVVNRPRSMELESVEAFMARGGSIERLRNGQVSKASQFQRLEVRA